MNDNTAFSKLENKILDGSLYDEETNVLALAKENGFVVCNADMDDADGFIAVDEDNVIPKFGSHKVIGVNAKTDFKRKEAFIAQELIRYYAQKQPKQNVNIKFVQRDTVILNKENFAKSIIPHKQRIPVSITRSRKSRGGATPEETMPVIKKVETEVTGNINKFLSASVHVIPDKKDEKNNPYQTIMNIPFRFINNDDEERINPFLTDFQRQREGQVSELFTNYINLYNKREKNKNLFRGILFWFCIVLAAIIIGVSLWMLHIWLPIMAGQYTATPTTTATVNEATPAPSTEGFRLERLLFSVAEATSDDENGTTEETTPPKDTTNNSSGTVKDYIDSVLASNASTAAKDIVAIISVCITILGSIFGLLRMIAIYVLPKDEEKNMQEIVKMIHENDFKDVVVRMLYAKERYEEIVKYLKLPETPGKPDDPNKKDSKP